MENIAKVFRGKEARRAVDNLASTIRLTIEVAEATGRGQDLVHGSLLDHQFSIDVHKDENRYTLFDGSKVMAMFRYVTDDMAVELITCTVISILGGD